MSRHVDLIAVAVLALAFMFAERLHEIARMSAVHARLFNVRPIHPLVIAPPHVPAVPHLPALPRVQY